VRTLLLNRSYQCYYIKFVIDPSEIHTSKYCFHWKNHIDQMIPKLSGACYFAHFHSIMKYGVNFWGNSSKSTRILTLQKKIIRIMAGAKPRNSCGSLFKGGYRPRRTMFVNKTDWTVFANNVPEHCLWTMLTNTRCPDQNFFSETFSMLQL
jgi:hypothetical protein